MWHNVTEETWRNPECLVLKLLQLYLSVCDILWTPRNQAVGRNSVPVHCPAQPERNKQRMSQIKACSACSACSICTKVRKVCVISSGYQAWDNPNATMARASIIALPHVVLTAWHTSKLFETPLPCVGYSVWQPGSAPRNVVASCGICHKVVHIEVIFGELW